MLRRIEQFLALDWRHKVLFLRAWFLMGRVRWALARKPFKALTSELKLHRVPAELPPLPAGSREIARSVGWAVRTASKFTPWQSTCLVQVLAAQRLLKNQGIAGVFYLGATNSAREDETPAFLAHAWLKCDGEFITGEPGHERYTVVSSFSW